MRSLQLGNRRNIAGFLGVPLPSSKLDQVRLLVPAFGVVFEPVPRRQKMGHAKYVLEDTCPLRHVTMARTEPHPDDSEVRVEKAVGFALAMKEELGREIGRWREEMLREIEELMEYQKEEIWWWFQQLPEHGKDAYNVQEAKYQCVAWPSLRSLGRIIG